MTKREITDRYAGQVLGSIWAVGHPLILMAVYVWIFAVVFKLKASHLGVDMPRDYATYILSGLIPWLAFQESMSKGTSVISGNANLVKQVVFPIEILPVKGVLAAMITQFIATALLMIYVGVTQSGLPWTYLLVPLLWAMQFLAMVGVSYVLSAVGAYFRDLKDVIQVLCLVGMYFTPIFYTPMVCPAPLRPFLYLNPFSYLVFCYQDACYYGRIEHPWAWPVALVFSVATFYGGYRVFRKLKTFFGSVL